MNRGRAFKLWGAAALLLASQMGAAMPCGFHGGLGDGFSAMHPKSINVAFALRDAADAGVIDPLELNPKLADMLALHRATKRLEWLRNALQSGVAPPSFALLLVESGMWSRYATDHGTMRLTVHVNGPTPGVPVVVTGDAVMASIAAGRISPGEALRRGLIVVDGPSELAKTLAEALARDSFKATEAVR